MGLIPYGYYACPVAGGIDRIFGFDIGKKKLPKQDDNMHDQLNKFCRYCGIFKRLELHSVNKPVISKSWASAYTDYKLNKIALTRY
jgi:hypothetical protein